MNDEQFEAWVAQTAVSTPYPPTPNVATAVRRQLDGTTSLARSTSGRLRWAAAAASLLLVLTLVAVPPARAALFSWLRVGNIELFSGGEPTVTPIALPDLAGTMTLDAAQTAVSFNIRTPAQLGEPSDVYLIGDSVLLAWADEGILLQILGFDISGTKMQVIEAEQVTVGGKTAVWLTEPHFLTLYDGQFDGFELMTRRIDGNVLIWVEDGLTYRLESHLSLEEAVELAESLVGG